MNETPVAVPIGLMNDVMTALHHLFQSVELCVVPCRLHTQRFENRRDLRDVVVALLGEVRINRIADYLPDRLGPVRYQFAQEELLRLATESDEWHMVQHLFRRPRQFALLHAPEQILERRMQQDCRRAQHVGGENRAPPAAAEPVNDFETLELSI